MPRRHFALAPLLVAALACGDAAERSPEVASEAAAGEPIRTGGRLVVALRAEPRTFNPLLPLDNPSRTVMGRVHADLVHIDRRTQRTVAALAESWQVSPDRRRITVKLRRDVRFSDGEAFDADDVLFTYGAVLDETVGAPHRSLLTVEGEPIAVRKVDSHTVDFEMAAPYAVAERLFDSIAILPEHRLAGARAEGRIAEAWAIDTPPAEVVGLGPFRMREYRPGERLVLERNPHYWKTDAEGRRLPYLDEVVFLFVASEDAQAIRFEAGETDVTDRLSAPAFAALEAAAGERGLRLEDLGPGLSYEMLFFNLNRLADGERPELAAKQNAFRDIEFRRAVSEAVDRQAIARLAYEGRATPIVTPVTPGDKLWRHPGLEAPAADPDAARRRLAAAGYSWNERGTLVDPEGRALSISLVTNSSNRQRVQAASVIQQDLARIGLQAEVAPLEFRSLIDRVFSRLDYEACLLGLGGGDADPNAALPLLLSDGDTHLWDLAEPRGVPGWQAEIDRLMRRQLTATDPQERRELYFRVQEIVAEASPAIFLVSPNVLVGARRELGNFRPAVLFHPTLWNADELYWRITPANR